MLMLTINTLPTPRTPSRDPAERNPTMRLFYRDWRPTRLGKWVNDMQGWWCAARLPPTLRREPRGPRPPIGTYTREPGRDRNRRGR
jgi:hypothetical protein